MNKHELSSIHTYDAIMVLGGNIRPEDGTFVPTTYADTDRSDGMLGGHMRVIAAACLFLAGKSDTIAFSTGTSDQTLEDYGPSVPTEASVYRQAFEKTLAELRPRFPQADSRKEPIIALEDRSKNTESNIYGCYKLINEHGWRRAAFLSSDAHIERIEGLCYYDKMKVQKPDSVDLSFISAEKVVQEILPGAYDEEIAQAWNSEIGRKRIAIEANGVAAIKAGTYFLGGEYFMRAAS